MILLTFLHYYDISIQPNFYVSQIKLDKICRNDYYILLDFGTYCSYKTR